MNKYVVLFLFLTGQVLAERASVIHEVLVDESGSMNHGLVTLDTNGEFFSIVTHPLRRVDWVSRVLTSVFDQWGSHGMASAYLWSDEVVYVGSQPKELYSIFHKRSTQNFESLGDATLMAKALAITAACNHQLVITDGILTDQELGDAAAEFHRISKYAVLTIALVPHDSQAGVKEGLENALQTSDRLKVISLVREEVSSAVILLARIDQANELSETCSIDML